MRKSSVVKNNLTTENGARFSVDGKYFKKWQEIIAQFKKDLEGIELSQEQRDIYNVVLQQKDKIRLRINDLNELEDIFVSFGTRKKGVRKLISVHYAGLRNPVTALEVLNIGDVIRRGKLIEEGTKEYPTSRRYELKTQDGAILKVIIDFNKKNDKNRSVINFYSDRKSDTGAHNVSSGIITDLGNNISQNPENANATSEKSVRKSVIEPVGEGGFRGFDPHKAELWAKFIVKIANATYVNNDAAAAFLEDNGVRVAPADERTLTEACHIAQEMVRARNRKIRTAAEVREMGKKDDFYKIIAAKYGSDFLINAGPGYDNALFTGSFMDKHKTEKGRGKSVPAEDIAKLLTEKLGREVSAKNVVEHFGHLKKDTLLADLRERRRKRSFLREIEAEIAEEERMKKTGDEYGGAVVPPEDSPLVEAATKRFIAARSKAEAVR